MNDRKHFVSAEFENLAGRGKAHVGFWDELDLGKASLHESARLSSGFPVVRVPMKMQDCEDETPPLFDHEHITGFNLPQFSYTEQVGLSFCDHPVLHHIGRMKWLCVLACTDGTKTYIPVTYHEPGYPSAKKINLTNEPFCYNIWYNKGGLIPCAPQSHKLVTQPA